MMRAVTERDKFLWACCRVMVKSNQCQGDCLNCQAYQVHLELLALRATN